MSKNKRHAAQISQKKIDRIRDLRRAGKTLREIADEVGVTLTTAYKYGNRCKPTTPPETLEEIHALRRSGASLNEISTATHVSVGTVARLVRSIPKGKRPENSHTLSQFRMEQIRAMRQDGRSYAWISQRTGISESTVKRHAGDIEIDETERRIVDSIDCGCRVCVETIRVDLPDNMSGVWQWASTTFLTCGACGTCFSVKDLLSSDEMRWLMGGLDKGNHYVSES